MLWTKMKKCIRKLCWLLEYWSEVYKNCVSDQIQWLEMTKIFDHYCSLKMLCQKGQDSLNQNVDNYPRSTLL